MSVTNPEEVREQMAERSADGRGPDAGAAIRTTSLWRDAWHRYINNRAAVVAGCMFLLICAYVVIVPWVSPYDANEIDFGDAYLLPTAAHPLGTDQFGRDLMTRVALGGRVSIGIGFVGTFVILAIGILYGSVAGFVGGKLDNAMMRMIDAIYGLPYLPFAIIILQVFGVVNFWTMVIALTIVSWLTAARVVRGQIITLKENDYVRAARAVGARWYRILGRHLLPNTLGLLIVFVFLELPGVILGEAFLSFIGLGISPPNSSWGSLAQEGRDVFLGHPWIIVIPSVAIGWLILCANFIADGLRDALDPRTREN
ncbi:MAG TPA: ABC transporter permease [Gaiellaceae bacterium]|nr:ABC transporter permease [Gaiellaceae bacterium]